MFRVETPRETRMGPLRFELKSITPEATRIPSYPTGPDLQYKNIKCIKDIFGKNVIDFILDF